MIDCQGAPRDLGLDQGAACRSALGGRFADLPWTEQLRWRLGLTPAGTARQWRELSRHLPRQAEQIEGLARGAGVPRSWLEDLLARSLADPSPFGEGVALASPAGVGRARPADAVLRRARPDGGMACLELALPWLTGALAAVSEVGIAGAVVSRAVPDGEPGAPATLLLQDALHRLDSLPAVLDWCLQRPAGGRATLLFADASGEVAGVEIDGGDRRLLRPADGVLVAAADVARRAALAKALREADGRALPEGVWLDPAARTLETGEAPRGAYRLTSPEGLRGDGRRS